MAYGDKAISEMEISRATLKSKHPELPVCVICDQLVSADDNKLASRKAKVNLLSMAPQEWDQVLYLDADTRVYGGLSAGFAALDAGWDIAMRPSDHQGGDVFWHVGEDERQATMQQCGYTPLQLQCGVMFIARNERTGRLYKNWNEEWRRWQDEDQAAFVRALDKTPLKIWMLGHPWNGGAVIAHKFGSVRQ